MKSSNMRTPAIAQIFTQKMTYQNHLKKLSQIRQDRKNQLNLDHSRQSHLQHIKDTKSKSFAHKFNEQNIQINQSNIKFLVKLQKVKPFTRYTSYTTHDRFPRQANNSFIKPITKRKIIETQKENSRLFFKMRSVSSTLNQGKMLNDYAKAKKIKERITKYANQNNKIALKSQKYFSQNKSFASNNSCDNSSTSRLKRNLVSHYNKDDIIKNRISNTDHRIFKYKRQGKDKALPSLRTKEIQIQQQNTNYVQQKNAFFTTEPVKNKRSQSHNKRLG